MRGDRTQIELGRRLRRLRLAKQLSQKDLAAPRYTAAYVSTIEAGRRMPSRDALAHFAKGLEVSVQELLTGEPSDLQARLEVQLHDARVALAGGGVDEAVQLFEAVATSALPFSLVRLMAKSEEGLGLVAERKGRYEDALPHFEEAERLWATEPAPLRAEAVAGRARAIQMMGDVRYAAHILEAYLFTLTTGRMEDPAALMRVHSSLVYPYCELGLYEKAAEAAAAALRLEARVEDPAEVANMHVNVARSLLEQRRPDDALTSLDRAEQIFRSLDWKVEVARTHLARGIIRGQQGDVQSACDELRRAVEVFEETGSSLHLPRALNELARVERVAGRAGSAKAALERSIPLLREGDVAELARAHRELGLCHVTDAPEVAEKHLRNAIELYGRAEESVQVAATYQELGDLLSSQGDMEGAREVYREGLLALG